MQTSTDTLRPTINKLAHTFLRMVRTDKLCVQTDDLNDYMCAAWHELTGAQLFDYAGTEAEQDAQRAVDMALCDAAWTLAKSL